MLSARTISFRVHGGAVVDGNDPLLSYCEIPTASGGVYRDLLRTPELPDGWFEFSTIDGITRAIAIPPARQHTRKTLRRTRTPLRTRRRQLTPYGQGP
jgi:hypothetical protein